MLIYFSVQFILQFPVPPSVEIFIYDTKSTNALIHFSTGTLLLYIAKKQRTTA